MNLDEILAPSYVKTLTSFIQPYYFDIGTKEFLNKKNYEVPKVLLPLFKLFTSFAESSVNFTTTNEILPLPISFIDNKKILIGFSGGKDSVAIALKTRKLGYEPILVYVKSINKSYPQERNHVFTLAEKLKCEIVEIKLPFKASCEYNEHPLKNIMILANMIDYGVSRGIFNYCLGNKQVDTITMSNINNDFSDSLEVIETFNNMLPSINIMTLLYDDLESFNIIPNELWVDIHSCIIPDFRRPMIRKANLSKFGGEGVILPNRCGTCWKCSLEYLILTDKCILPYNKGFVEHCIKNYSKNEKELEQGLIIIDSKDTYRVKG